jgi:hypothetical protein
MKIRSDSASNHKNKMSINKESKSLLDAFEKHIITNANHLSKKMFVSLYVDERSQALDIELP